MIRLQLEGETLSPAKPQKKIMSIGDPSNIGPKRPWLVRG